jgi:hypothetical protein
MIPKSRTFIAAAAVFGTRFATKYGDNNSNERRYSDEHNGWNGCGKV